MKNEIRPEKPENYNGNQKRGKKAGLFSAFVLAGALGVSGCLPGAPVQEMPYNDLVDKAKSGQISTITVQGNDITGRTETGEDFHSYVVGNDNVFERLKGSNVPITAKPVEGPSALGQIGGSLVYMVVFIGLFVFIMRKMQSGAGGAGAFGKSKAKLLTEDKDKNTFSDVAGIDEVKADLQEIVEFLKEPQKFQKLGGKIPKGVLLVGSPGTGKTLTARAVAGEANVPFFTISGSDFVEMFVGVGASRVRDLFEQAKKNAPCIIFIDEIDAVGRRRGAGLGGGHDEREQTLNQLLVEMDGFEESSGVILIAATNRPDVLDPALLRPGRFDRQIVVPLPDVIGREAILKVHTRTVPLADDVDFKVIARGTPGYSGADMANLVNEAALLASRRNKKRVDKDDFEGARDKILLGAERPSMVMTKEEKKVTAYHEAGHALVGLKMPGNDPLHKVTIIPRGRALGVTMNLPERDRYSMAFSELKARLAMMYGGRIAEEILLGPEHVTTGASNDIEQATNMARKMVTEWGMSDKLGLLRYGADQEQVFLGMSMGQSQNLSEEMAKLVDTEIRRFSDEALAQARKILTENKEQLETIANALLEYETLSGQEVRDLLEGKPVSRPVAPPVEEKKPEEAVVLPPPEERSAPPPSPRPPQLGP